MGRSCRICHQQPGVRHVRQKRCIEWDESLRTQQAGPELHPNARGWDRDKRRFAPRSTTCAPTARGCSRRWTRRGVAPRRGRRAAAPGPSRDGAHLQAVSPRDRRAAGAPQALSGVGAIDPLAVDAVRRRAVATERSGGPSGATLLLSATTSVPTVRGCFRRWIGPASLRGGAMSTKKCDAQTDCIESAASLGAGAMVN